MCGSSHSDVPVNPVWPNDPNGKRSPRLPEYVESMSHPRPRTSTRLEGEAGAVILATVGADRIRTSPSRPWSSSIRQNRDKSAAVLKSPAWPATPPMRRAVGSWTMPRRNVVPGLSHGHASGAHRSVGAIRGFKASGGRNIVSVIPKGSKTWALA